jgi:hypothetical protein
MGSMKYLKKHNGIVLPVFFDALSLSPSKGTSNFFYAFL